jgi:hypothetical protein
MRIQLRGRHDSNVIGDQHVRLIDVCCACSGTLCRAWLLKTRLLVLGLSVSILPCNDPFVLSAPSISLADRLADLKVLTQHLQT